MTLTAKTVFIILQINEDDTTMNTFNTIWPIVLSNFLTAITTVAVGYVSVFNKLRMKVILLEHRVTKSEQRLDRKSQQIDEIVKNVPAMLSDVKQYVQGELAELKSEFADVRGDVKALVKTLEIIKDKRL